MKIEIVVLLFSFYSATSAIWFWRPRPGKPTVVKKRDCKWQDWARGGLCLDVTGKPFPHGRLETRSKIPAQGGGKKCTGLSYRIADCNQLIYRAHVFMRTYGAHFGSGGSTSRRTLNSRGKKCVADVKDENGNVTMSGRKCPSGTKKKRRVIDDLETMQRRTKRQAVLSTKNRDVLFLLDESGSVGKSRFKSLVLRMAEAMTNSFCGAIKVSKPNTHVGVLTFNRKQYPQIDFNDFFEKAKLINAMKTTVKYHGYPSAGATCLVDALKYTRTKMLTPTHGARNNIAGTERIVILITDGCANCEKGDLKSSLNTLGGQFTADGVPIITFLIGDKPGHCFKLMQGLADGSQCYQQFWAKDWKEFEVMIEAIEQSDCMDAWMIGPSC